MKKLNTPGPERKVISLPSSPRLTYTRVTVDDFPAYFRLAGNLQVMQYITGTALNEEQAHRRFAHVLKVNEQHPELGFFFVHRKDTQELAGLVKLEYLAPGKAEIGYLFLPGCWGRGYGSETAGALIDYTRLQASVQELIGNVTPDNQASRAILLKYGFTFVKTGKVGNLVVEVYQLLLTDDKQP